MPFPIREVTSPASIAALHAEVLAEQGKVYTEPAILAAWSQRPASRFLVAGDRIPVGFLAYESQGERCQISDLYVQPSHRRLGIARSLLRQTTRRFAVVELEVAATNTAAIELYFSEGFQPLESEPMSGTRGMRFVAVSQPQSP
jgi:ribosomal protein S18 acetylase RimI-like enzyme